LQQAMGVLECRHSLRPGEADSGTSMRETTRALHTPRAWVKMVSPEDRETMERVAAEPAPLTNSVGTFRQQPAVRTGMSVRGAAEAGGDMPVATWVIRGQRAAREARAGAVARVEAQAGAEGRAWRSSVTSRPMCCWRHRSSQLRLPETAEMGAVVNLAGVEDLAGREARAFSTAVVQFSAGPHAVVGPEAMGGPEERVVAARAGTRLQWCTTGPNLF